MAQAPGIGGAGWQVAGDRRHAGAGAVRSVGRRARGKGKRCKRGTGVGHSQIDGGVLQARPGGTGGRTRAAGTGRYGCACVGRARRGREADNRTASGRTGQQMRRRTAERRAGGRPGGRTAGGHVLGLADTAKRTVQVRVTGTARRWRDGRARAAGGLADRASCRYG